MVHIRAIYRDTGYKWTTRECGVYIVYGDGDFHPQPGAGGRSRPPRGINLNHP